MGLHVKNGTPALRYFRHYVNGNATIGAKTKSARPRINFSNSLFCLTSFLLLFNILSTSLKANNLKLYLPTPLIAVKIGSHNISVGLQAGVALSYSRALFHLNNQLYYNFKAFGTQKKGLELRIEAGANYLYNSNQKKRFKHFLNNTTYANQVGYSYLWYFDQFKTSQNSGILRWVNQVFQYEFENDFLAFKGIDKFRTGAVYFAISSQNNSFFIKNINYTGDPYGGNVPLIQNPQFKHGYKDMRQATFGNKSIGTLSIGWLNHQYKNYNFGAEIGIDADQIRNFMQNKLIHDNPIMNHPKKGIINPHIPMLCPNGTPYYYAEGQQIRKPKIYWNVFLNSNYLY